LVSASQVWWRATIRSASLVAPVVGRAHGAKIGLRARPDGRRGKPSAGTAWFPTPDHSGDTVGGVGVVCFAIVPRSSRYLN
jgi:hypothetical protein